MKSDRVGKETERKLREKGGCDQVRTSQVPCPPEHAPETGGLSRIEERATQTLGRTAITGTAGPRARGRRPGPAYNRNAVRTGSPQPPTRPRPPLHSTRD